MNWIILGVGAAWVIIAFVMGFILGVFSGYKMAIKNLPEIESLREELAILDTKVKRGKK